MFDFRYHIVSLAAVFLALVIGILVGIGLSGKGFVDDAERTNLQGEIASLREQLDRVQLSAEAATSRLLAMEDLADEAYDALVQGRLAGRRVAVLYVGEVPGTLHRAVQKAVSDGGGRIVRMRAVRVPYDATQVEKALGSRPALFPLSGGEPSDIGRELGSEFSSGGRAPVWAALSRALVVEQQGDLGPAVDAVVVARPVVPQQGPTKGFLAGLYRAVGAAGLPAVGVEETGTERSALPVFATRGLSTVDSVDTAAGRLALVLLLAGAENGRYGVEEFARDGIVPPLDSVAG